MFFLVVVILLGLVLDLFGATTASSATPGWQTFPSGRNRTPSRFSSRGWNKLPKRQTNPTPSTTIASCDQNDGYFYLGSHNYTYQLQCKTKYTGVKIGIQNFGEFEDCIGACVDHNVANGAGTCLGASFKGNNVVNTCTLWSDVSEIVPEEENEDSPDSALLIYGPRGQVFATALADSGASSTSEGTSTSTSTSIIDTSNAVATTSSTCNFANASITSIDSLVSTQLVVTLTLTSTITEQYCLSVADECAQSTGFSTPDFHATTSPVPTSRGTQVTDGTSVTSPSRSTWTPRTTSIGEISSSGGLQPTSAATSGSLSTEFFSITGHTATTASSAQTTLTNLVRVTEFRVQPIEICVDTYASCSRSSIVDAIIGFRTEISCSPGICTGVAVASGVKTGPGTGSQDICVRL